MSVEHQNLNQEQTIDLAGLLNILWRRRWLVLLPVLAGLAVGLLYGVFGTRRWEAFATIRPGITAFDPSGGPVRQWQLKDITRWYEQELYRKELTQRLGLPKSARPVIKAEFISAGLTNLAGGDVITLWTTATSPELAAAILDTSMVLFKDYAEADSISSQLKLTRDGLLIQIQEQNNQRLGIELKDAGFALSIEAAAQESVTVAQRFDELALSLKLYQAKHDFCLKRAETLQGETPRLQSELERLDEVMGNLQNGVGPVTSALPDAIVPITGSQGPPTIDGLTDARLRLFQALTRNQALIDSLAYEADRATLDLSRTKLGQENKIKADLREVEKKIGDLRLKRKIDIPSQSNNLDYQIAARKSKLSLLSPLQRVGQTVVSDKPVRPRTFRATAILVFLGLLGGSILAFGWEFVAANRRVIFRS